MSLAQILPKTKLSKHHGHHCRNWYYQYLCCLRQVKVHCFSFSLVSAVHEELEEVGYGSWNETFSWNRRLNLLEAKQLIGVGDQA